MTTKAVADPHKVGLVIGALIGGVALCLVGSRSAWLGATDLRFHFLGAHDQAGLLRETIRSGGCGCPHRDHRCDRIRLWLSCRDHLVQAASSLSNFLNGIIFERTLNSSCPH